MRQEMAQLKTLNESLQHTLEMKVQFTHCRPLLLIADTGA